MKAFIAGLLIGILLAAVLAFYLIKSRDIPLALGELLDQDAILLDNGKVRTGFVILENDTDLVLQNGANHYSYPKNRIKTVRKDILSVYLRGEK
ncbi:MAG: hypothetical protein HQL30_04015 [Candidatus Omnitrophica bacterium]|nr:hypothetical protein [Candidatus Omnitrophota bacterium]